MRNPINFCIFFYTLYFTSSPSFLNAQDFEIEWENNAGGSQWDEFRKTIKTSDGNIISIGFSGSNDFDLVDSYGIDDVLVQKHTSEGELIWSRNYGGSSFDKGIDIVEKPEGGFILACMSKSIDGDVTENKGGYDIWMVHINAEGDILWQKSFGGSGYEEPANVIIKENGNYVIAASSASGNGDVTNFHGGPLYDYWLFEIDTIGNIIWQNCFGSISEERCKSMIRNLNGGYLLNGNCTSNGGDVTGNHSSSYDMWVVSVDSVGNLMWQRSLGGSNTDVGTTLVVLPDTSIIVISYTKSIDGDVSFNYGASDTWVVCLDTLGGILWKNSYGGSDFDHGLGVIVNSNSNLVILGLTASEDGIVDSFYGVEDFWLLSIDLLGNLLYETNFGGTLLDEGFSLFEFDTNSYVLAGQIFSGDIDISENYGSADAWLLKIALCEYVFYHDADIDGYGNVDSTIIACEAPLGFVSDTADCNDTIATIYPGAIELCNYLDDDCDGLTDENLTYILSYQDNDSDEFGNPLIDSLSCELPIGYVIDNTDCDDTNAAIYPGAEEVLNGIDDDCDQNADEDLAINELIENSIFLHPNPTASILTIHTNFNEVGTFTIYTSTGQSAMTGIWNSGEQIIFVQTLAPGIYSILLESSETITSGFFVKL